MDACQILIRSQSAHNGFLVFTRKPSFPIPPLSSRSINLSWHLGNLSEPGGWKIREAKHRSTSCLALSNVINRPACQHVAFICICTCTLLVSFFCFWLQNQKLVWNIKTSLRCRCRCRWMPCWCFDTCRTASLVSLIWSLCGDSQLQAVTNVLAFLYLQGKG